ncbi:MAG: prepilin-type N-terminal cleavage/methylation domain-containing protein [Desulfobacteraceae bacterium]
MFRLTGAAEGFTLLEIMVSISIIAVVFVSLFKMQAGNITLAEAERFYSDSFLLARKIVAGAESDLSDTVNTTGDFKREFDNFSWTCTTTDSEPLSDSMDGEQGKLFKRLTIEIAKGEDHSIQFHTWRYAPEVE